MSVIKVCLRNNPFTIDSQKRISKMLFIPRNVTEITYIRTSDRHWNRLPANMITIILLPIFIPWVSTGFDLFCPPKLSGKHLPVLSLDLTRPCVRFTFISWNPTNCQANCRQPGWNTRTHRAETVIPAEYHDTWKLRWAKSFTNPWEGQ